MRTLAKLTAGVVVLLALTGCSNDPKSEVSALEAPPGTADTFDGDAETLGITADSVRLLAEENGYAFYAAFPANRAGDRVCLVLDELKTDQAHAGCGDIPSVEPIELGIPGVRAKLVVDDYDASKELAEGWRQPHQNLLVRL